MNILLQYEYFYASCICLAAGYICTMFGYDINLEEEHTDTAYFCHTVMDKNFS